MKMPCSANTMRWVQGALLFTWSLISASCASGRVKADCAPGLRLSKLNIIRRALIYFKELITKLILARYTEFKDATGEKRWPFRYTAPWVAVLQSILVLVQTAGGEKRCAGRAINAMIGKRDGPVRCPDIFWSVIRIFIGIFF